MEKAHFSSGVTGVKDDEIIPDKHHCDYSQFFSVLTLSFHLYDFYGESNFVSFVLLLGDI